MRSGQYCGATSKTQLLVVLVGIICCLGVALFTLSYVRSRRRPIDVTIPRSEILITSEDGFTFECSVRNATSSEILLESLDVVFSCRASTVIAGLPVSIAPLATCRLRPHVNVDSEFVIARTKREESHQITLRPMIRGANETLRTFESETHQVTLVRPVVASREKVRFSESEQVISHHRPTQSLFVSTQDRVKISSIELSEETARMGIQVNAKPGNARITNIDLALAEPSQVRGDYSLVVLGKAGETSFQFEIPVSVASVRRLVAVPREFAIAAGETVVIDLCGLDSAHVEAVECTTGSEHGLRFRLETEGSNTRVFAFREPRSRQGSATIPVVISAKTRLGRTEVIPLEVHFSSDENAS